MATPATRTGQVYEVIRGELLNGGLRPGQKLTMAGLTGRFGVSQSVIREALTRLTEQGLLIATPQRGFRVRDLSIQDIAELTETRIQVESLALRLAVQRGDLQWETAILAAHHRLDRTPVTRDDGTVSEDWSVQHRDFHQALLTGCGNRSLESVATSLRDSAELYRRWYWVLTDDHQRDLAREHRQLKDLALARDADQAIEVLTEHIDRAPSLLIAYAREHGVDDLTPPAPQDQASGQVRRLPLPVPRARKRRPPDPAALTSGYAAPRPQPAMAQPAIAESAKVPTSPIVSARHSRGSGIASG